MKFRITGPARRDSAAAIVWSLREFRADARDKYRELISLALIVIAPEAARSATVRPKLGDGVVLYRTHYARSEPAVVQSPCHFLVYRFDGETAIILRILHDAMELPLRMADD